MGKTSQTISFSRSCHFLDAIARSVQAHLWTSEVLSSTGAPPVLSLHSLLLHSLPTLVERLQIPRRWAYDLNSILAESAPMDRAVPAFPGVILAYDVLHMWT